MFYKNLVGKLIISKSNDYYKTFHDLKMILVKGNGNKIVIDHTIPKLLIYGNNNTIAIEKSGEVGQTILQGNNNIIIAKYLYTYTNNLNYGEGNRIYVKTANKEEIQSSEEESLSNEENESEEEEVEEEEKQKEFEKEKIHIERPITFKLDGKEKESNYDDNLEDYLFGSYDSISGVPIFEIQNEIKRQLQREREKELFTASIANIVFGNIYEATYSDPDNILNDLIDIPFKNASSKVKEGKDKCVICCDEFEENESVKMTNCFHIFHFKCIKQWIERKQELIEAPDCPICRREL